RRNALAMAKNYETLGAEGVAKTYGVGPGRVPFEVKDPRGFREFFEALVAHDALGAGNTMRGYQGGRPSIYDFETGMRAIALPTLIIVGDEDDSCIEPSLFMKQTIPAAGLAVF